MGGPASTDVLAVFLDHGSDPNKRCDASTFGVNSRHPLRIEAEDPNTPWTLILNWRFQFSSDRAAAFCPTPYRKFDREKRGYSSCNETVVELFLKAGRSTSARFRTRSAVVKSMSVPEILKTILPENWFTADHSKYFPCADTKWWRIWCPFSEANNFAVIGD